ncbi:MAG TPA: tetratricopeptide repeat protein [Planctomycetes bacterium]|nr:tetratricopeptide repeat protein [Planctomycetota bacterium]
MQIPSSLSLALGLALLLLWSCGTNGGTDKNLHYSDVENPPTKEGFQGDASLFAANAQRFYDAGDYLAALQQFRKQLEKDPTAVDGRLGEAYSLYKLGVNLAARGAYKEANRRLEEALDNFEKLSREIPMERDTLEGDGYGWKVRLGLALSERALGALAKRQWDRIHSAILSMEDPSEVIKARAAQKVLLKRRVDYNERALEHFRELAAMGHPAPDVILNVADMELIAGNESLAERYYLSYRDIARRSVESWDRRQREAPDQIESKNELERVLSTIEAKRRSAVEKLVKVLERLAEMRFDRGEYAEAASLIEEALKAQPDLVRLHVPMAEILEKQGKYRAALEHIDIYLRSLDSFDENAKKAAKLRSRLLDELKSAN